MKRIEFEQPVILQCSDLARMLNRAVQTIYHDVRRAPGRLPPQIRIPGRAGACWLYSDVIAWLEQFRVAPPPATEPPQGVKKSLGRPFKSETLRRRGEL